jgi:magnesium chelatase family protein
MDRTKPSGGVFNGRLEADALIDSCTFAPGAKNALYRRVDELGLSARAGHSVLKVALTIADIEGESRLTESIIEEALGYRSVGESGVFSLN